MQTFFCDVPLCKNNFIAAQNASIFATIKMFLLRRRLYVIECYNKAVCNGSGDAWHYITPHRRRCYLVQCISIKNNRSL